MSTSAVPPASLAASQRESDLSHGRESAGRRTLGPTQIVVGLTLFGAILRFATLDVQSIWSDEAATIVLVHRGLGGLLSHISTSETTPPLYFVLVWGWTKVFGTSVFAFRSLSALVGTITIPVIYLAGRRISPRVGIWAAALTTVNPAMYYYSQEARSYALLILFSAAALVFWQRALERPGTARLAGWAAMSALALLTHYFAAFLFIPEAAMLIRRLGWRRALPWAGAVAAVGLALLPLAHSQSAHVLAGSHGSATWIEETPLLSRLAQVPKQFLIGLYSPEEIVTTLLAGLLAAAALTLLVRRGERRERRLAYDVAIVAAVALLIPAALAVTHLEDVFNGRNVMATWVPWVVLLACGLGAARAGRTGTLLGASICTLSLLVIAGVNLIPGYQREDWRGIARALQSPAATRVIVAPELGATPLFIYMHTDENIPTPSIAAHEVAFVALSTPHTGHAPLAPVVPTTPPPGFHLIGVRRAEAFAISRFRAVGSVPVSMRSLRRIAREPKAEIFLQR
ncbi:MAG TPA: glycosyltransferase family 39 protein [Solirubrobacteraceae bacterium]|nr:glycosyltransferase family 39 protein [Solirubrobacteraceae bacterium]